MMLSSSGIPLLDTSTRGLTQDGVFLMHPAGESLFVASAHHDAEQNSGPHRMMEHLQHDDANTEQLVFKLKCLTSVELSTTPPYI